MKLSIIIAVATAIVVTTIPQLASADVCDFCIGKPPGTCACSQSAPIGRNGCQSLPAVIVTLTASANSSVGAWDTNLSPSQSCLAGYMPCKVAKNIGTKGWFDIDANSPNGTWEISVGSESDSSATATWIFWPVLYNTSLTYNLGTAYAPSGSGLAQNSVGAYANSTFSCVVGESGSFGPANGGAWIGMGVTGNAVYADAYSPTGAPAAWTKILTMFDTNLGISKSTAVSSNTFPVVVYPTNPILAGFTFVETNADSISWTSGRPVLSPQTGGNRTAAWALLTE